MTRIQPYSYCFISCLVAGALVMASPARASDAAVNIAANIIASPCQVATGSAEQSVDLGKVWTSQLVNPNDATDWKPFSLSLTNCPSSTTEVVATMSGTPDVVSPGYYLNTGSSKNVAIDVMDDTGQQQLSNGKTLTVSVDNTHATAFKMKGRMITPSGEATSGTVIGLMELTLAYR